MPPYLTPFKRVTVPVYGSVDTTSVQPIMDHAAFQHTFHIGQLGFSYVVFPGARHTRGEHLIGAMAQCREWVQPLVRKQMITPEEAHHVEIGALLHDAGHGPYSHVLERVLQAYGSRYKDHKERTIDIILNALGPTITACGASPERVAEIVTKKDPLSSLISHKTIGADKVAYVRVDQHHCGFPPSKLELGDLAENIMYIQGALGVDERMTPRLKDMQNYYFSMYTEVYMRKQTRAVERLVERGVQLALQEGALHPDEVWPMTDAQLIEQLHRTPGPWSAMVERVFYQDRHLLKAAVVLRLPGHTDKEIIRNKNMTTISLDHPGLFFSCFSDPRLVLEAEQAIAKLLEIPLEDVIFSCVDDPARLVPEDVSIFDPHGSPNGTLFSRFPDHQKACREQAQIAVACRVMVAEEHREHAAGEGKGIYEILTTLCKTHPS